MYGRWVDVLIAWSILRFMILRYSFEFQCHVLYKRFIVLFAYGRQLQFVLGAFNTFGVLGPSNGHRVHQYYA